MGSGKVAYIYFAYAWTFAPGIEYNEGNDAILEMRKTNWFCSIFSWLYIGKSEYLECRIPRHRQPRTKHICKQRQSASLGTGPFCLGAISSVTKTPYMTIKVVITTSDALFKVLRTSFSVVLDLYSRCVSLPDAKSECHKCISHGSCKIVKGEFRQVVCSNLFLLS